jgi:3-oxoacyl-[acyl-carrier protein] reductase
MSGISFIKDSVAVITGAGRGIGRAIAIELARQGALVACIARSEEQLRETVRIVTREGGKGLSCQGDVTDYQGMKIILENIRNSAGKIGILIINAGINADRRTVEESLPDDFAKTMNVNLFGTYYTAKAGIPYLIENGNGHVVFTGSGVGLRGMSGTAAYACSKAGVHILVQVLSEELKQYSIAVNELIPGPVITDMTRQVANKPGGVFSIEGEWIKQPHDVTGILMSFLSLSPETAPSGQSFSLMRRIP